jgi:phospholipase/lecithinase/hemolysin
MTLSRRFFAFVAAVFLVFPAAGVHAQNYSSIVVFGDSLSDTGNDTDLSLMKYGIAIPGPAADYTFGRFTDGTDTFPAADHYTGVWIEQLAAMMPSKPVIVNSLNGGNNYAYGFAFAGQGTGNLVLTTNPVPLSITVDNIGLQISTYLAIHPKVPDSALYVIWGGANDLLNATSASDIVNAATHQILNIQALIQAGASHFLVPNLPPLGDTPRINVSPAAAALFNAESALYNQLLAEGLAILNSNHHARTISIYQLDVFSLFNRILASPSSFGMTNVTASSQGLPVNPDNYLFWDDLHPTTHAHHILATTAAQVLAAPPCTSACPGVVAAR